MHAQYDLLICSAAHMRDVGSHNLAMQLRGWHSETSPSTLVVNHTLALFMASIGYSPFSGLYKNIQYPPYHVAYKTVAWLGFTTWCEPFPSLYCQWLAFMSISQNSSYTLQAPSDTCPWRTSKDAQNLHIHKSISPRLEQWMQLCWWLKHCSHFSHTAAPYKEPIVLSHSFDIVRDITRAGPHSLYATPFTTWASLSTLLLLKQLKHTFICGQIKHNSSN